MGRKRTRERRNQETTCEAETPVIGRVRPRLGVALVLGGVAFGLGLVPALMTPWDPREPRSQRRTPPDEIAHMLYVQDLVRDHRLPLLRSGSGNYEAHQPPLYYLLAIPARQLGVAVDPPSGPGLAGMTWGEVLALRVWSAAIASGVVVSCYLVGCAAFPRSLLLQIATAAFALLLPGHLISLAAVTNDGLAELFCCLVLFQCVALVRWPLEGMARFGLLGLLIGAALLTKTSCVFLVPVALLAALLGYSPVAARGVAWGRFAARATATVAVAAVLWAPWIAHNLAHYPGDPLVTRTFTEVFGRDRPNPEWFLATGMSLPGYARMLLTWTYCSFWGVFGEAAVFMPGWYYLVGAGLTIAALVGIASGVARWTQATREARSVWSILFVAGILVMLQFARFQVDFFQAQARYLFPAIAPIACAFAAGFGRVGLLLGGRRWPESTRARVLLASGAAMAVLLVAAFLAVMARGPVGAPPSWIGMPR